MSLFEPTSIAVIGASATEGKVGHALLSNLLTQGYKGKIYPVNPKHEEVLGKKAFPSITDIPGEVECAVIATPAPTVTAIVKECDEKGVKTLVIISAGFSEMGTKEGEKLEEEIKQICLEHEMQLVGTNCLGIIRPSIGMNASFAKDLPEEGNVAFVSQSGALAVALMDTSASLHLGYSLVLSIGNKTLMDECDFLELCEADPKTKVIGLYLESIDDGRRFLELASRITPSKPIVLIKSGTSVKGKHAVSSHTGALAGSDAAIDAVCAQTGIRRAQSSEEFLDLLRTLSMQPPLLSPNIAIVTNAGGPGILATDAAEREGLLLPSLEKDTVEELKEQLPAATSTENPIDVLGDATTDRYHAALAACMEDPNIDGIAVLLTPQIMTPVLDIAKEVVNVMKKYPLMPIATSFMGRESVQDARTYLRKQGIPSYETPERAIRALAVLQPRTKNEKRKTEIISTSDRSNQAENICKKDTGLLSEPIVEELFSLYNLPLPKQSIAQTPKEAVKMATEIGFPVIAKLSSPDILHKTDIGGIRANLNTEDEVSQAFEEIMTNVKKNAPDAKVNGVLIQQFLPPGNEFIVGSIRDPSFGPLVMVGLGGIYTELFRDTSFRIAPITEEDAYEMLQELKSWDVLLGIRGKKQSDIDALAQTIVTVGNLVTDCSQIKELDLNPVFVDEKGVTIADAKVMVG